MMITIAAKGGFAGIGQSQKIIDTAKLAPGEDRRIRRFFRPGKLRELAARPSVPGAADTCDVEITIKTRRANHQGGVFVISENLMPSGVRDLIDRVGAS